MSSSSKPSRSLKINALKLLKSKGQVSFEAKESVPLTPAQPKRDYESLPKRRLNLESTETVVDLRGQDTGKTLKELIGVREFRLGRGQFSRLYLDGADFRGLNIDFEEANFLGACLQNAFLAGANLEHAVLNDADLRGTDLSHANLSGANLQGADLTGAKLGGANLLGADFRRATLKDLQTDGWNWGINTKWPSSFDPKTVSKWGPGMDLQERDFEGQSMVEADLTRSNLRGANLNGVKMKESCLSGAIFDGAQLRGVELRDSRAEGASFQGADLRDADLSDCFLIGASFKDADLRGVNLENTDFGDKEIVVELKDFADMRGADLRGANLNGVDFSAVRFDTKTRWPVGFKIPY